MLIAFSVKMRNNGGMKKGIIITIVIGLVVIGAGLFFVLANTKDKRADSNNEIVQNNTNAAGQTTVLTEADKAGKLLSANRCQGTDKPQLTHLPMDTEDFSMIIPYGMTAGGHVTPIDHQYFEPVNRALGRDAYEVYAMADARIVAVEPRARTDERGQPFTEYRMVFTISCRLFYYYDLVTSLAPDLKAAYERDGNAIDFPVQSGQLIGYIGGQTLDFAVWDTEYTLTGYIVPEHYQSEAWKIYTADPLLYYTDEIRAAALAKYIRTAEPRSGRIDYDIDGKLIGNWFQAKADGTTDGYAGTPGASEYWLTHLSFLPDHLDPTGFIISIGNWPGGATQFAARGNTPDPATVGVETGLVKYNLTQVNYKSGNAYWNRFSFSPPITFEPGTATQGCLLVQLTETRALTVEAFKDKACTAVAGFTSNAVDYTR